MQTQLQKKIMRRIYILAVLRALLKRRMRRFYAFVVLFSISSEYLSYPHIIRNLFSSGSPVQNVIAALVGAPGFKLALVLAVAMAGTLFLAELAKKDEHEYSYA